MAAIAAVRSNGKYWRGVKLYVPEGQSLAGMACALGRCGYGRKALVVFLCISISVCCEYRVSLCLPLFSLWYGSSSEGGTFSGHFRSLSEGGISPLYSRNALRAIVARFYIVLPACPPSEGGTISRVNSAPSEGEDVSENVAAVPVCVGRSILLLRKE